MIKFKGWQPAGPAGDGKTQVYRTSTMSAIHLMSVLRAFDINTILVHQSDALIGVLVPDAYL